MSRVTVVLAALVGLLLAVPVAADAACAGPALRVDPASARPGDQVTVIGSGWGDCPDTESSDAASPETTPVTQIEITLTQGSERWRLATVDANQVLRFQTVVTIPDDAAPRTSTIEAQEPSVGLAAARFTVEGAGGTSSGSASGTSQGGGATTALDELPRTGRGAGRMLVLALAALAAGGLALAATRRTRAGR